MSLKLAVVGLYSLLHASACYVALNSQLVKFLCLCYVHMWARVQYKPLKQQGCPSMVLLIYWKRDAKL